MNILTFEQITDNRFDNNILELLQERVKTIFALFKNIEGIEIKCDEIRQVEFDNNTQYRCRFYIKKRTRKITWNDIYGMINNVKAVPYHFIRG